jgi:hypothetical protein
MLWGEYQRCFVFCYGSTPILYAGKDEPLIDQLLSCRFGPSRPRRDDPLKRFTTKTAVFVVFRNALKAVRTFEVRGYVVYGLSRLLSRGIAARSLTVQESHYNGGILTIKLLLTRLEAGGYLGSLRCKVDAT